MGNQIISLSILISFFSLTAYSQTADEYNRIVEKYPDEGAVMLEKREQINIELNKEGIDIFVEHYQDKMLLNRDAQGYLGQSIYYNETFSSVSDIDAHVLMPNGKKYKKTNAAGITTEASYGNGIFYDDTKRKIITYPPLIEGGRSVLSYREQITDPHFLGSFHFSSYVPVMKAHYSVVVPEGVKIKFKVFNDEDGTIQVSQTEEKGKTVWSWSAKEVEKYEFESNAPSVSYREPHVVVYIEEYKKQGKPEKVLDGVTELYTWYRSLVSGVNDEPSEQLRAVVDSLITGNETDEEKVRKVFYWVQDHIKYVAFEDGMAGFIPRSAAEVCSKRYGDCKGMSSIITEMLEMCDVPSYLTWIGSRDIPYSYHELPTPMVDNHMIAAVKLDGEFIFLDATGQYSSLGMPTSFIQGKEALVGIDDENYEVVPVPVIEKEKNYYHDSVFVTMEDKVLKGKGKLTATGFEKFDITMAYNNRRASKQRDFMDGWLEKGHNKFHLDKYDITAMDDRDKPLEVDYQFSIRDYAVSFNDEIYVNLNLDKIYFEAAVEKTRELPIEHDYKYVHDYVTVLEIPEGYTVGSVPENTAYENDQFGFEITYEVDKNTIVMKKNLAHNTLLLEPENFETWNEMIEALNTAYNEAIKLVTTN